MKVTAVYCREDYNAFDEYSEAGYYGIDAEVPDDTDMKYILEEANKSCAIRLGYRFCKLQIFENNLLYDTIFEK